MAEPTDIKRTLIVLVVRFDFAAITTPLARRRTNQIATLERMPNDIVRPCPFRVPLTPGLSIFSAQFRMPMTVAPFAFGNTDSVALITLTRTSAL